MPQDQDHLASGQPDPSPARQRAATLANRGRVSWKDLRHIDVKSFGKELYAAVTRDDLTGRAAQLAYYFFFALFPMLIAASALLGVIAKSASNLNEQLLNYMATMIPPTAFQIVADTFHQTTHASSGGKVLLGALVAIWSASSGTSAIQDALNSVYNVRETRPFWRSRLVAVVLTIVVGLLFTAALTALFLGDKLVSNEHGGMGFAAVVGIRLLTWPVAFGLVALGFALVYWKAPDLKDQPWEWVTPGAGIGILVWLVASLGLRVYLHYFNSYSVTYGSLGAVIVLLTWFYLSGLALLLGAAINDTLELTFGQTDHAKEAVQETDATSKVA